MRAKVIKWLRKKKKCDLEKVWSWKSKTLILRKQQFWSQKVTSKEKAPNQNNKSPALIFDKVPWQKFSGAWSRKVAKSETKKMEKGLTKSWKGKVLIIKHRRYLQKGCLILKCYQYLRKAPPKSKKWALIIKNKQSWSLKKSPWW